MGLPRNREGSAPDGNHSGRLMVWQRPSTGELMPARYFFGMGRECDGLPAYDFAFFDINHYPHRGVVAMPKEKPESGKFCWNELMTRDTEGSAKFYSALLGWTPTDSGMAGYSYTLWKQGETDVGGMMEMPKDVPAAVPPHWMSYVAVDDVDAVAAQVNDLGGTLLVPPQDIPDVGRFCILQDPSGATLGLITFPGKP